MLRERGEGFTLLEVMIAVFVFALVVSLVIEYNARNLAALADARRQTEVAQLGEGRMRDLYSMAIGGLPPEIGTTEGAFDPPNDDVLWELSVEEYPVPLPPDLDLDEIERARTLSSVFQLPGESPDASSGPGGPPSASSVRRIELRVFPEERGPETADVFGMFTVDPPDLSGYRPPEPEVPAEDAEQEVEPEEGAPTPPGDG